MDKAKTKTHHQPGVVGMERYFTFLLTGAEALTVSEAAASPVWPSLPFSLSATEVGYSHASEVKCNKKAAKYITSLRRKHILLSTDLCLLQFISEGSAAFSCLALEKCLLSSGCTSDTSKKKKKKIHRTSKDVFLQYGCLTPCDV